MYDKVKLLYPRTSLTPDVSKFLDSAKEQIDLRTGEVCIFGNLEGLKVCIYAGGISIIGSLPKYIYPNNIYLLNRSTTAQAIEKLSDALHLPLNDARVTGLEFGNAFMMRQPVESYLSKLGEMPRLQRYHFDVGSLYYKPRGKQQPKIFAFYDKIADARVKGMVLPEGFKGANLLKYEMRLNGRLHKQLGEPEVKASTLTERAFYAKLVTMYQESYFSIHKSNQVKPDMSQIKTVSDAYNVLVARLISQSDKTQITGFLDELKANNVFADRKSYTRLKNKIEEVSTKAGITMSDELIKELDDEVKNVGAYV